MRLASRDDQKSRTIAALARRAIGLRTPRPGHWPVRQIATVVLTNSAGSGADPGLRKGRASGPALQLPARQPLVQVSGREGHPGIPALHPRLCQRGLLTPSTLWGGANLHSTCCTERSRFLRGRHTRHTRGIPVA
jgi:hypothetical protein